VSFTLRLLYPRSNISQHLLNRRLGWLQSRSGGVKKRTTLASVGVKYRLHSRSSRNIMNTLNGQGVDWIKVALNIFH